MNPRQWKRIREVSASLRARAPVTHRELYATLASEIAFRYGELLPPYPDKISRDVLLEWLPKFDIMDPTEVGSVGKYFLLSQAKALVAKYDYEVPGLNAWAEERAWRSSWRPSRNAWKSMNLSARARVDPRKRISTR